MSSPRPKLRMAVVGSPAYLAAHPAPKVPQQLSDHICINLRLPTRGGLYAWEFERGARKLNVRVDGQLVFNTAGLIVQAAVAGMGLACLPQDAVKREIEDARLVRVLGDWCPPFPGYHLYYPSRRQQSPAFALLVEALRYRPRAGGALRKPGR